MGLRTWLGLKHRKKAMEHYTIISGTGRAGTTLLVRVLTRAGLDTGFEPQNLQVDPVANAGLEWDLRAKPDCYIVKSPWIATYIEKVLPREDVTIDHAIICVRDLWQAAESRRKVQALRQTDAPVPGGLWETTEPERQEAVLAGLFYKLIFHLSAHDIPTTFLHFPRFAIDPEYCVTKLSSVFDGIDRKRLEAALHREVRRELIGDFPGTASGGAPLNRPP
jgi:hypothetical protein